MISVTLFLTPLLVSPTLLSDQRDGDGDSGYGDSRSSSPDIEKHENRETEKWLHDGSDFKSANDIGQIGIGFQTGSCRGVWHSGIQIDDILSETECLVECKDETDATACQWTDTQEKKKECLYYTIPMEVDPSQKESKCAILLQKNDAPRLTPPTSLTPSKSRSPSKGSTSRHKCIELKSEKAGAEGALEKEYTGIYNKIEVVDEKAKCQLRYAAVSGNKYLYYHNSGPGAWLLINRESADCSLGDMGDGGVIYNKPGKLRSRTYQFEFTEKTISLEVTKKEKCPKK